MGDYVKKGNSRQSFFSINNLFQEDFSYNLTNFNLFNYKLTSQSPSEAVHFI